MVNSTLWRGGGIGPFPAANSVQYLWNIKANLIRYELAMGWDDPRVFDPKMYLNWIATHCSHIQSLLSLGTSKQRFCVSLMTPPGGLDTNGKLVLWGNPTYRKCLLDAWDIIAVTFKNNPEVHVYDLCNECQGSQLQVHGLHQTLVTQIRLVDKLKRLSITPAFGSASNFRTLKPIAGNNLWYTFHFYKPFNFTHQGIYGYPSPVPYTGSLSQMEGWVKPVIDFAKRYDVPIYAGEFSASNLAPPSDKLRYLQNCISLWEKHGFQWSYHAFFESGYWSPSGDVTALLTANYKKNRI